jgi:hypothetical protein
LGVHEAGEATHSHYKMLGESSPPKGSL